MYQYWITCLTFKAFGAPNIVAHIDGEPQMFFGSDRFLLLAHMMGKLKYSFIQNLLVKFTLIVYR